MITNYNLISQPKQAKQLSKKKYYPYKVPMKLKSKNLNNNHGSKKEYD